MCGTLKCSSSANRCLITQQSEQEDNYITKITKCMQIGIFFF